MNSTREERFCELAHKALAREANPAELAELEGLLRRNPTLKSEFEQMRAGAAAAREILPLLAGLEPSPGRVPEPPWARLKAEVAAVFTPSAAESAEFRDLLTKFEKWSMDHLGAERRQVMEWLSTLRRSLSSGHPTFTEGSLALREAASPATSEGERGENLGRAESKKKRAKAEPPEPTIEERLRSLQEHLLQLERLVQECREEVRKLLESCERKGPTRSRPRKTEPPPPRDE